MPDSSLPFKTSRGLLHLRSTPYTFRRQIILGPTRLARTKAPILASTCTLLHLFAISHSLEDVQYASYSALGRRLVPRAKHTAMEKESQTARKSTASSAARRTQHSHRGKQSIHISEGGGHNSPFYDAGSGGWGGVCVVHFASAVLREGGARGVYIHISLDTQ
ncbi:hypothetical protein P153DRAFT_68803 [Dothidotthia symphoricarpi CBS 119687]|uniref:Uncharacterized protein n=1 Tax=Dothidotthia symphoricarpi CBS 119687 TaxID=1392245 RepID=A0A6A6A6P2_9PLEO|nr:uncharacterized protein P153DRAFT_68803 [Dothidotthia symphoricarpi CBS 119687]KAF2126734.1 hypothetical protein P153DRAFT_68803 [Dothidotthia symphoricarpi CBS 119687]